MVVLALLATLVAQEPSGSGANRVRDTGDAMVAQLLLEGLACSPTFRGEVAALNQTNGVIYVEQGACRSGRQACLLMSVTVSGANRILRIHIDPRQRGGEAVGYIGHELQHAIEALSEAGITTGALMYAFFERVSGGSAARGQLAFETEAALRLGDKVAGEVSGCRR